MSEVATSKAKNNNTTIYGAKTLQNGSLWRQMLGRNRMPPDDLIASISSATAVERGLNLDRLERLGFDKLEHLQIAYKIYAQEALELPEHKLVPVADDEWMCDSFGLERKYEAR